VKTAGRIFYNKMGYYVQNTAETDNASFCSEALARILTCQALHVTSTIRTSQGVNLAVYENELKINSRFQYKDQLFGAFQKYSDVEFGFC